MTEPRTTFHSNDLILDAINGKTQEEWEAEWNVTGEIEHLKKLGWNKHQWRHRDADKCKPNVKLDSGMRFAGGCFAEFFSDYYHGYLRGDGVTVAEAVNSCLNRGQKMAACEQNPGHTYETIPGYTNGLVYCRHCGFNGHMTMIEVLRQQIDHLKSMLQIEKQMSAERVRHIQETGRTYEEAFTESMEQIAEALKSKDEGPETPGEVLPGQ